MEVTSPIVGQPVSGFQEPIKSEDDRTTMNKDDFLELFVKSLQYQDPLEPMENGQMMQQLSQLGMMEQVTNMKEAVETLSKNVLGNQVQQGASMLGKTVTALNDDGKLVQGQAEEVRFREGLMEILVNNESVQIGQIQSIGL
jgi:flagellar basal-body rod modification protein FlgD